MCNLRLKREYLLWPLICCNDFFFYSGSREDLLADNFGRKGSTPTTGKLSILFIPCLDNLSFNFHSWVATDESSSELSHNYQIQIKGYLFFSVFLEINQMLSLRPKIFSELSLSCSIEYLRYYKQSAWSWLFLKLKRKCSEEMRQNQEVEEVIVSGP